MQAEGGCEGTSRGGKQSIIQAKTNSLLSMIGFKSFYLYSCFIFIGETECLSTWWCMLLGAHFWVSFVQFCVWGWCACVCMSKWESKKDVCPTNSAPSSSPFILPLLSCTGALPLAQSGLGAQQLSVLAPCFEGIKKKRKKLFELFLRNIM